MITADADGQHSIQDILQISRWLDKDTSGIILGTRSFSLEKKIPLRSRFGNTLTRYVLRWLTGLRVSDTQTGLRGIPLQYLKLCCKVSGEKYEYEMNELILFHQEGVPIFEIPIQTIYENDNKSSHFNPIRDSLMIYKVIFSYAITSFLATAIDFLIFSFSVAFGASIYAATAIGRCCAALINFVLNRKFVFQSKVKIPIQLIQYFLLVACSGAVSAYLVSAISKYSCILR